MAARKLTGVGTVVPWRRSALVFRALAVTAASLVSVAFPLGQASAQDLESITRELTSVEGQADALTREPAILDFGEIQSRRFTQWSMGLLSSVQENRDLFLKYSSSASFDPSAMGTGSLRAFFEEVLGNVRWLG